MTPSPLERLPGGDRIAGLRLGTLGTLGELPYVFRELMEAGMIRPVRPSKLARMLRELRKWGTTPAAGIAAAAIDRPDATMVIDELGSLSFRDVHERSNALAHALRREGIREGDGVAIMCRNHRWFIEATLACAKLGASALYMNTGFAAPQFRDVVKREGPSALIYDEEFAELLAGAREAGGAELRSFVAWSEDGETGDATVEELITSASRREIDGPEGSPRFIILTSGTTGTPKGAQRGAPQSLSPVAAMLSRLGLRARETTMIAAPAFHSWGFAHLQFATALGSTVVFRRRFDPEGTLAAVAETRAKALVVVPVMMQRILDLPEATTRKYDVSSLRVVAASGSALPGPLATRWMDRFGDNIYNFYGTTEVAYATIATPEELRVAPGTAGSPPRGTIVKIYDQDGRELPAGKTGRIFVGNEMPFEGYTGGGGKETIGGLLATGDVGYFDAEGRLFVAGRDDEMIVSGGENVFPREVEDLLAGHDAVREVAVIGVDDEEFGQRLKAFVVLNEGANLGEKDAKDYVKANLANYKAPREVVFLDSLPRNPTGKVLKRELV